MKKKVVALLLTMTMVASLAVGCGKKDEVSKTKDGKTEIEFWYSGGKTAVKVVQDIIDEYNDSQDKYEVTAVTQGNYDETYQKLQAAIAGKSAPDMALLDATPARSLFRKNLVTDVTDMIEKDDTFKTENYLEVFMKQCTDDNGEIYAIPAYGTTQIMYYNIEAFEKAGIKAADIHTWQQLAAAAKSIQEKGYEFGWEPMWGGDNFIDACSSNGASVFSEDGKTVTINAKEWVEVGEAFRKWIHDDKIMAIHSGGQGWEYWYSTMDDALNGVAGGYTGSSGDQADLDFTKVAAMEQPAWDDETTSAPMAEALTLSVLKNSPKEEQEGAFDFIKFFTNAQSQTKWTKSTGYVASNKTVKENDEYKNHISENPNASVPFSQASHGSIYPVDPTNGAVMDAIKIAVDEIEIEGKPAQEALDKAQASAQAALEEALAK